MKRWCSLVVLLLSSVCFAQFPPMQFSFQGTPSGGLQDKGSNIVNCTSNSASTTPCWSNANGGSNFVSINFGGAGVPVAMDVNGCAYGYGEPKQGGSGSWTQIGDTACGMHFAQFAGDGFLYALVSYSGCSNGGWIPKRWNLGSGTWTTLSTHCFTYLSMAKDSQVKAMAIDLSGNIWKSGTYFGGGPWSQLSGTTECPCSFVTLVNSATLEYFSVKASGGIITHYTGTRTTLPGATNAPVGSDVTGTHVWVVGTDNFPYHWDASISNWDKMKQPPNKAIVSVDFGDVINVWAITTSATGGLAEQEAEQAFYGKMEESGATHCVGAPCPTPPAVTHEYTLQTCVQDPTNICPAVTDTGKIAPAQAIDINSSQADGNPDCFENVPCPVVVPVALAVCSFQGILNNAGGATINIPCITENQIPKRRDATTGATAGWPKNTTINVYISTGFGTDWVDVCTGVSTWTAADLDVYHCFHQTTPPPKGTTGPYMWITFNSSLVDGSGKPMARNHPCGLYFDGTAATGDQCPSGGELNNVWIEVGPYAAGTQLIGAMVHEEGHDNWLADCPNCIYGATAMGSQPTWSAAQPQTPQACDLLWSYAYSLF